MAIKIGAILQSEATIEELKTVIERKKFDKYLPEEARFEFLKSFLNDSVLIPVNITITDCRDPRDNKFLELAVSGEAAAIVSGDDDLLVLHPFRSIPIITPRQFLEDYQENS